MDKQSERRDAIGAADDTGLIGGEELITEAETLLPLRPELPREQLHAALPEGHGAHGTIDRLHAEVAGSTPNAASIAQHVGALRSLPELEATVANWWDDPKTQRFISNLNQIGL